MLTKTPFRRTHFDLRRRRGATVVEFAIIYPLAFLLIIGVAVGGLGVFRYQQVAHLAQLSARYAAVHGGQYAAETGKTAATQQEVFDEIANQCTAMDRNSLSVTVFLNVTSLDATGNPTVTAVAWDSSNKAPYSVVNDLGDPMQNTVSATVQYQWLPEVWLTGPITLSSTATVPMQY
jgi:Flp pilus assembly protein TadG